jgi:hypothetical protein
MLVHSSEKFLYPKVQSKQEFYLKFNFDSQIQKKKPYQTEPKKTTCAH